MHNFSSIKRWVLPGMSVVLLLLLCGCVTPQSSSTPFAPTSTNPLAGINLIVNGDAESGPGSNDGSSVSNIPGWTPSGNFTVIPYDNTASGSFPLASDPGPSNRGKNFFAGGESNASSSAYQEIALSSASTFINAGNTRFTLSAYLGGWDNQDDHAQLSIQFQADNGQVLGTVSLPTVSATDRHEQTALIQKTTSGTVPSGTRKIKVELLMTREEGDYNDGYADNLSLVLR